MSAYNFFIRVVVVSAIAIVFQLTRGFGSILETFAMAACAGLVGHGVVWGIRKLAGPEATRRTLAIFAVVVTAISASAVFVALDRVWPRGAIQYMRVDEVMAAPERYVGEEIKLHGYLESGTLQTRVVDDEVERVFTLSEHEQTLAVRLTGPAPDLLQDRAEVVAQGVLRAKVGGYTFVATEVMAKCPSTYNTADGPQPAEKFR